MAFFLDELASYFCALCGRNGGVEILIHAIQANEAWLLTGMWKWRWGRECMAGGVSFVPMVGWGDGKKEGPCGSWIEWEKVSVQVLLNYNERSCWRFCWSNGIPIGGWGFMCRVDCSSWRTFDLDGMSRAEDRERESRSSETHLVWFSLYSPL